ESKVHPCRVGSWPPQFSGTVTGTVAFYDGTTVLKTVSLFRAGTTGSGESRAQSEAKVLRSCCYCSVTTAVGFPSFLRAHRCTVETAPSACHNRPSEDKAKAPWRDYAGDTGFHQRANVDDAPRGTRRARQRGRTNTGHDTATKALVPDGARSEAQANEGKRLRLHRLEIRACFQGTLR